MFDFPPPQEVPQEVLRRIEAAALELTQQMRQSGTIPDDWRIDVMLEPAWTNDLAENQVRLIATPRPPFDRWSD